MRNTIRMAIGALSVILISQQAMGVGKAAITTDSSKQCTRDILFSNKKYAVERKKVYQFFKAEFTEDEAVEKKLGHKITKPNIDIAAVDLDDDGVEEILAYIVSRPTCSAHGCSLLIYKKDRGELINTSYIVAHKGLKVLCDRTNQYKDIEIIGDAKQDKAQFNRWQWNGNEYVCSTCGTR